MDRDKIMTKWRVLVELSNNKTSYDMITMRELAVFVKSERKRLRETKQEIKALNPLDPWLMDMVFARIRETFSGSCIMSVEIMPIASR